MSGKHVDPDQTPRSAASDLGLHVCSGMSVRILKISTVVRIATVLTQNVRTDWANPLQHLQCILKVQQMHLTNLHKFQKSLPVRMKGFHMYNEPPFYDALWALYRPLLTEKTQNRVNFLYEPSQKISFSRHIRTAKAQIRLRMRAV